MAGVYSVTQVNSYIKNMFTQDFLLRRLSVKGEVSNCKYHTSGHIYFTLKDKGGTLSAVMFASQRRGLGFRLEEGQQVVVKGTVDVYERDGKYQLYAQEIELAGRGDLYIKFEKLLRELEGKQNRKAQFRTAICLMMGGEEYLFEGIVKGEIIEEKRGSAGFGYDPIFVPEGFDKTFAELGNEVKNTVSHRALAVEKLCRFLKG